MTTSIANRDVSSTTYSVSSSAPNSDMPPTCASQILNGMYSVGMNAASGALAGYVFALVNPVGGAIFGATSALAHALATGLSERFAAHQTAIKCAVWSVSCVASCAIGLFVATAAGFPMTVAGAVGMTAAMVVTTLSLKIVTTGVCCYSTCAAACVGGGILAAKERWCPRPPEPLTGGSRV